MKTLTNFGLSIACGVALLAVGCAQQGGSDGALSKDEIKPAVGKPGASVQFSHKQRTPATAGTTGTIDFTISENYDAGGLWLQATGDNGLNIVSGAGPVRYDMYSISTHQWSVSFSAANDGVYYVNVLATVEPDGQPKSSRAYAVRVEVGDVSGITTSSQKNGELSQSPEGEAEIILDADEEIDE